MADKESNNCEVNREVRHLVSMANDIADNLGFRAEAGDNSAERIADMTAMPSAPACSSSCTFGTVIPPIAMTGMDTFVFTSPSRLIPTGGPYFIFDGVS